MAKIFPHSVFLPNYLLGAFINLAKEYNLPAGYFSVLMVLFPLGNGLSRVVAGSISDKIGREKTMVLFYSLLGLSILCFVFFASVPFLLSESCFSRSHANGLKNIFQYSFLIISWGLS